jgi:uncharacterized protein (DUF305 family)
LTDRGYRAATVLALGVSAVLLVLSAVRAYDDRTASHAAGSSTMPDGSVASPSVAAPNGLDMLFAKMMVAHHAQAVTMSETLLAKPGVPERAGHIAGFIARDQRREIGEMNAWLQAWGQPPVDPADPAVARLHGTGAGHGMLTDAQLAEITQAAPAPATRLYLQHMIEHHRGAITMAQSILDGGANAYIRGLAKHIINEQSAENDVMSRLLSEPA